MIDPSFDTQTIPTPLDAVGNYQTMIADLQKRLEEKNADWGYIRQELTTVRNQVAELENFLKETYTDMDESHVEQIASIFGIQLEREYFVTITATFSGTVTAPLGYDMDDLENDLQANIDTHYYGNSSVYVDLSEDSMEIDWQEG